MALAQVYESHDEGEFYLIKSLLEGNNIPYVVENEHFGSLYPGSSLPFNGRRIFVPESDRDRVCILLSRLSEEPIAPDAG